MMNQYYGNPYRFGGRSYGERRGERAPYRRPMGRGALPINPYGSGNGNRGGGGCGLTRENDHGRALPNQSPHEDRRAIPVAGNSGCGCCHDHDHGSASCKKLLEQIRAVDFALYEVILYLDVYPHSCDALETYHKLKARREALRKEYENVCGPLTAFSNESGAAWDWIGSPFPWEYGAE